MKYSNCIMGGCGCSNKGQACKSCGFDRKINAQRLEILKEDLKAGRLKRGKEYSCRIGNTV